MAAAELAARFTDGAILVDLSPLSEPTLVPSSIGAALGLREGTERVVERLGGGAVTWWLSLRY